MYNLSTFIPSNFCQQVRLHLFVSDQGEFLSQLQSFRLFDLWKSKDLFQTNQKKLNWVEC